VAGTLVRAEPEYVQIECYLRTGRGPAAVAERDRNAGLPSSLSALCSCPMGRWRGRLPQVVRAGARVNRTGVSRWTV